MILKTLHKFSYKRASNNIFCLIIRNASVGLTDFKQEELTSELKHDIERHWRNKLVENKFNPSNVDDKFYVLSMFPYPSGNLHMGHVRVYTISDAMARFYRMNGKNVLHPIGWDAFGLPAENAANQRNVPADVWTEQNITQMKNQLTSLGCSFDWDRELATCDPTYYKWTQSLFLKLFNAGLAYQKEALVNWDPVDKTVLANEQVDEKGHSWRSGAKVEKKLLRQWFIKTTKFSKSLYDGLSSPSLVDWRDIINLQKHWIGECDGFTFDLPADNGDILNVWTKTPEHFESAAFIAISKEHALNKDKIAQGRLNFGVENPFNGKTLSRWVKVPFCHWCWKRSLFSSLSTPTLKILCQNPFCLQPLQERIVPTLVSILNIQGEMANSTMQDISLDVLQTIVKYSTAPLSDQLILNAFPAAVQCILNTDDHAIMQSGGECLRAFVFVAPEQVCSYRNGEGLNYIMQVITMLLNPMNTEFSAVFVGRLVITVITKAASMLGENVYLILKAVISKMQLVESLSVAMSLILTFAHLFISQMDALLNFLSTVPGPTGEPAIQYVFSQWLCRQQMFYGVYERKVSTMALCKLLEHGVTTKDVRLTSVTIRDKIEVNGKARTRSQTTGSEVQWTNVPILVKIFKLLINELAFLKETNAVDTDSDSESESTEKDTTRPTKSSPIKVVSDLMYNDDNGDDSNDQLMQELMQDPAFDINMEENLTKFLQNFSRDDNFSEFTQHLTQLEKIILQGIQVSVA